MEYYLQNLVAGYLGNSPYWWAEKGGYTENIDEAKLFSSDECNQIIRSSLESLNGYDFHISEETDSAIEEAKALIDKYRNLKNHS